MRFRPSVVHWPPALRIASSRTVGCPLSIAYRARSSVPFWPLHDTSSESCSLVAVRPDAALYCARLQLIASPAAAGVADTIAVAGERGNTVDSAAAIASAANT